MQANEEPKVSVKEKMRTIRVVNQLGGWKGPRKKRMGEREWSVTQANITCGANPTVSGWHLAIWWYSRSYRLHAGTRRDLVVSSIDKVNG